MSVSLVRAPKFCEIALVLVLAFTLSAWTCSVIGIFNSCPGTIVQPAITVLSPNNIFINAVPVVITVNGSGFVPESEVVWNGNRLPTTYVDSRHLRTTITDQTLTSFGASPGDSVQMSVITPAFTTGCTDSASATLILIIN